MPPRKAGRLLVARSSVRLKDRKQADAAGAEEVRKTAPVEVKSKPRLRKQEGSFCVEGVKDAPQVESESQSRRGDRSYVEEQIAVASGALLKEKDTVEVGEVTLSRLSTEEQFAIASGASLEEGDTVETRSVTRLPLGDGGSAGADVGAREVFDPACSFRRSKPGILTLDSARRQFEFLENPERPFSALLRLLEKPWNEGLGALSLVVERYYGAMLESARRRLQPWTKIVRVIVVEDVMFYIIRALAFLALLSTVIHVGWKICGTDLDIAAVSACKIPPMEKFCRLSCEHELTKTLFPNACSGHGATDGDESHKLSGDHSVQKSFQEPSLLERLSFHQLNCTQSRNVRIPMIDDVLPILVYVEIATTSEDVCDSLPNLVGELEVYYTGLQANSTAIHKHVNHLREIAREGTISLSGEHSTADTGLVQDPLSRAMTLWKEKFRALMDSGTRMQEDAMFPSRRTVHNLIMGLNDGLTTTVFAKDDMTKKLPWQRRLALWTELSWLEPGETRRITKAIVVLDEWLSEAWALRDILQDVDSDLMEIQTMVRDTYLERFGHSTQASWADVEPPELLPLLDWLSEDIKRIGSTARGSRVMGGLLQDSRTTISEQTPFQAEANAKEMVRGPHF